MNACGYGEGGEEEKAVAVSDFRHPLAACIRGCGKKRGGTGCQGLTFVLGFLILPVGVKQATRDAARETVKGISGAKGGGGAGGDRSRRPNAPRIGTITTYPPEVNSRKICPREDIIVQQHTKVRDKDVLYPAHRRDKAQVRGMVTEGTWRRNATERRAEGGRGRGGER